MRNSRIFSIIVAAFFVFMTVSILIPSMPSDNFKRVAQVAEAFVILDALREPVEAFYREHSRFPSIDELRPAKASGKFVAGLAGANPYVAVMKDDEIVAPKLRGARVEWRYDPEAGTWDKCSGGTVLKQHKPIVCRN